MHFSTKSYLKNIRNYTAKHALNCLPIKQWVGLAHFHDFLDSNIRNTQKNLLQYSFKSTISKGCKKQNLLSIEAQLYLE